MRPLEILLSLANLLTFFVLVVPRLRVLRGTRYWALIGLVIAGVQALVEGARWQMIPAYTLSAIFFLVWFLQGNTWRGRSAIQRRTGALMTVVGTGFSILGLTVSLVLPIILPVFRFPRPTGPYAIGTVTYNWVDVKRAEVFTADPNDHRELMVQIWYPAMPNASSRRAPWIQDASVVVPAFERLLLHVPEFTLSHSKYITTNAIPSVRVAEAEPNYPVLIFLHGTLGFRQHNTFQVEELVSHGYIVAAIDQPYAAAAVVFPDGRQVEGLGTDLLLPLIGQSIIPAKPSPILNGQAFEDGLIPYLAQDVSFTLDQLGDLNQNDPNGILTGRLDLQHTGIFGVSLGGIVGGEASLRDPRVRAFIVEDAPMPADVLRAGLRQPTMWISRDAATMQLEGWSQSGSRGIDIHQTTMRTVFQSLQGDGYLVLVGGMFHVNLTDFPFLLWPPLRARIGLSGPIDAQRAHNIINAYSLAFFDKELKGQVEELLDGPAKQFPEVVFETRRPGSTVQKP